MLYKSKQICLFITVSQDCSKKTLSKMSRYLLIFVALTVVVAVCTQGAEAQSKTKLCLKVCSMSISLNILLKKQLIIF
ncbi:hypothetical protein O3G_MSEX006398 [Manduca sexta]|uniref:Uncharacterized protein n=1 Tax=Manduca sexta TaxID=7130 RepID=A0A921Z249_MANSE|nr:hypothetical protein O3G_MSEX006398 [Manduca sexta]